MNTVEFKAIYKGTDVTEAERRFTETECFSIVYCEQGYGIAYIDGEHIRLDPHHALAFRSCGKSRGITVSDDFSGQFFLCEGTLAEALFHYYTEGKNQRLSPVADQSEKNLRFAEAIAEEGEAYLFHTLLRLLRAEIPRLAVKTGVTSVAAIKEYIDSHTEKKITLEKLSKHFFISKTQIHRLFTANYGISPMKYMLKTKIERSKILLVSGNMRISEIAEKLAFTDSKHFTKTFRNFTGILPGEYRKKNQ